MSYSLNQAVTADNYTTANTLRCPGAVRLNLEIRGAAIYYSLTVPDAGMPEDSWAFGNEVYAGRTLRSLKRRTSAIRIRSAAVGVPATVTVEAMLRNDLS